MVSMGLTRGYAASESCRKTSASDQSQIWITYKTPNLRAQRFYTVKPLELDLVPKSGASHSGSVLSQLGAVLAANPARLKRPGGEETPSMDVILDYVSLIESYTTFSGRVHLGFRSILPRW